jgi:hypothetical protein
MTITNQYLEDQGFVLEDEDDEAFTKTVGSFSVTVQVVKYRYDSATKQDVTTVLPMPRLGVHLPHQCDSWEVFYDPGNWASEQEAHDAALKDMREFVEESQQAHDIVARLDLAQIKEATRSN